MSTPAIARLKDLLGEKVTTNPYALETHGRDENATPGVMPLAVVLAASEVDVQTTLRWATEERIPVIPFGAGTSFEGQVVPQGPTVSLDLSRMNRVVALWPEDGTVEVEAGITREDLARALASTGWFFPVDPGANATLGGMAATNASGTTTVRYGGMRPNILRLRVVLASGEVLTLGRAVRKSSSGYDLRDLFIGSGGTLGVITALTLRLHPVPEYVHALRVTCPTLTDAVGLATAIMQAGLPVARLELLDTLSMETVQRAMGIDLPRLPTVFIEVHASTAAAMAAEAEVLTTLAEERGAVLIAQAQRREEIHAMWQARHRLYWSFVQANPERRYLITDVAVPLRHLVPIVTYAQELLTERHLAGAILGHVGDGNFHTFVASPPDATAEATAFSHALVERALELGGTATGEHGIGIVKRPFLEDEHGAALGWMRRVKDLFDPLGILNPGKGL